MQINPTLQAKRVLAQSVGERRINMYCMENNVVVVSLLGAGKSRYAKKYVCEKFKNRKLNILYLSMNNDTFPSNSDSFNVTRYCYKKDKILSDIKKIIPKAVDLIIIDEATYFLEKLDTNLKELNLFSHVSYASLLLISQYDEQFIDGLKDLNSNISKRYELFVGELNIAGLEHLYSKIKFFSKINIKLFHKSFGKKTFQFTKAKI